MYEACFEALANCVKTLVPGKTAEKFDAHETLMIWDLINKNECMWIFSSSTFSPNWMDWPMLYTGNPYVISQETFSLYDIDDSDSNLHEFSETYLVTDNGNERLGKKVDLITLVFYILMISNYFLYIFCFNNIIFYFGYGFIIQNYL